MSKNNNLPTLAELTEDKQIAKRTDQFNWLLNQEPPSKWVKQNKYAGNSLYLPIDKVENLLKRLFKSYKIEVKSTNMLLNSVTCHVRVHYLHPVTNDWRYHDGVGAKEVQTESGTGALQSDMSNVQRGAMEKCVPIAKTNAVKNACKEFGKLFGADLNRKNTMAFSVDENLQETDLSDDEFDKLKASVEKGTMSLDKASELYSLTESQIEELQEVL